MPIRLGVRGGQLPFGPGTKAPTEFAASAGTGRAFAQGRALIDLGVERLERRGGILTERVWTALVGLTVRPGTSTFIPSRSEERRGGEEGRSRGAADHLKKKKSKKRD